MSEVPLGVAFQYSGNLESIQNFVINQGFYSTNPNLKECFYKGETKLFDS